jgi:hypothetical protein
VNRIFPVANELHALLQCLLLLFIMQIGVTVSEMDYFQMKILGFFQFFQETSETVP